MSCDHAALFTLELKVQTSGIEVTRCAQPVPVRDGHRTAFARNKAGLFRRPQRSIYMDGHQVERIAQLFSKEAGAVLPQGWILFFDNKG